MSGQLHPGGFPSEDDKIAGNFGIGKVPNCGDGPLGTPIFSSSSLTNLGVDSPKRVVVRLLPLNKTMINRASIMIIHCFFHAYHSHQDGVKPLVLPASEIVGYLFISLGTLLNDGPPNVMK